MAGKWESTSNIGTTALGFSFCATATFANPPIRPTKATDANAVAAKTCPLMLRLLHFGTIISQPEYPNHSGIALEPQFRRTCDPPPAVARQRRAAPVAA